MSVSFFCLAGMMAGLPKVEVVGIKGTQGTGGELKMRDYENHGTGGDIDIAVGRIYRHFKGNEYIVLALARDSETLVQLVVYQDCGDEEKVWVRPLALFLETVEVDGKMVRRFEECPGQ